jgi:hypothetical protein
MHAGVNVCVTHQGLEMAVANVNFPFRHMTSFPISLQTLSQGRSDISVSGSLCPGRIGSRRVTVFIGSEADSG